MPANGSMMDAVCLPLPSVQVQCLASNPPDRDGLCPGWAQPQNHGASRPRRQLSASLLGTDRAGLSSTMEEDRAGKAAALRASLALALGQLLTSPGAWAPECSSWHQVVLHHELASAGGRRPSEPHGPPLPGVWETSPPPLAPLWGEPHAEDPGAGFRSGWLPNCSRHLLAARAPSAQETLNADPRSQPLKVYGDGLRLGPPGMKLYLYIRFRKINPT